MGGRGEGGEVPARRGAEVDGDDQRGSFLSTLGGSDDHGTRFMGPSSVGGIVPEVREA